MGRAVPSQQAKLSNVATGSSAKVAMQAELLTQAQTRRGVRSLILDRVLLTCIWVLYFIIV